MIQSSPPQLIYRSDRDTIIQAVHKAYQEYNRLLSELKDCESGAKIVCPSCNCSYLVSTQIYIQTHWYVEPHGCTEGDYWNMGEAKWKCPSCEVFWRFNSSNEAWIGNLELVALKRRFNKVVECYCKGYKACRYCIEEGLRR